ncbi:MAG: thermonuclease family protein [Pseudomonadota bacterium]
MFAVCLVAALCLSVVDGDTLDVDGERVRLWGVDASERGEAGYLEATKALRELVAGGVICVGRHRDRTARRRLVARCFGLDGRDVAVPLVTAGHVVDVRRYSDGWYAPLEPR